MKRILLCCAIGIIGMIGTALAQNSSFTGTPTSASKGNSSSSSSSKEAYFYFEAPKSKNKGMPMIIEVSSTMEIKWRIDPSSAGGSGIGLYVSVLNHIYVSL
jgi:hypothetical protein